jgi:hypothetical protein
VAAQKLDDCSGCYHSGVDCRAGVALAASVQGGSGDNTLYGTPSRDNINPFGGNDVMYALGGNDDVARS